MPIEDVIALTKARSLLVILVATCEQTLLALDVPVNALDTDMTEELRRMVARARAEIEALDEMLTDRRAEA